MSPSGILTSRRLVSGICLLAMLVGGCGAMPNSGASRMQVQKAKHSRSLQGVTVRRLDDALTRKLAAGRQTRTFAEIFGGAKPKSYPVGAGDTVIVSVWETPPSILFGGATLDVKVGTSGTNAEVLPPQMVMDDGTINMPFAGRIRVAGRTVREIEKDITNRLQGKANNPQVMVRVSANPTSQASVIGDVAQSTNLPLTPKGERLLDALAAAGGVSQPITRMSLQLSRRGTVASMPLDEVVADPGQNIPLLPGDVLTAQFQPWSISVLGATGKNQELPFEARGISLAQALARSGGLNDNRADPGGVFIFRFEDAALVEGATAPLAGGNRVPVVYQVDFDDPGSFFVTQNFPMRDKDVVYVANMPSAELEKFLRMVGMVLTPTLNLGRYQLQVAE